MLRTLPPGHQIGRRIVVPSKQAAVNAFVMGKSIAEIAQDSCINRLRAEQIVREALIGLAALVKQVEGDKEQLQEVTMDQVDLLTKTEEQPA